MRVRRPRESEQLRDIFCRNASLARSGVKMPTPVKTGTTIAGLVFKVTPHCTVWTLISSSMHPFSQDGVILGADTRATEVGIHIR